MTSQDKANSRPKGFGFVMTCTLVAVGLLAPIAWFVAGIPAVSGVLISAGVCLFATGVLFIVPSLRFSSTAGLLVSTFLRMGAALAVVLIVNHSWPELKFVDFYLWLALVYLFSVFLDAFVILTSLPLTRKVNS